MSGAVAYQTIAAVAVGIRLARYACGHHISRAAETLDGAGDGKELFTMSEKDEVRAVIENLAESFSRLDLGGWLANFHLPPMIVLPSGSISPVDAADAERLLGPLVESLRAGGFTRSSLDCCSVQLLTPLAAVASVDLGGCKDPDTVVKCYQTADEEDLRRAITSRTSGLAVR